MSPLAPSATAQLPTWHRPHLPNTPHIFLSAVAGDAPDPSLEPISSFLHLLPIPDTAVCGVCHQIAPHHGMYVSLGSRTSSCQPPCPNTLSLQSGQCYRNVLLWAHGAHSPDQSRAVHRLGAAGTCWSALSHFGSPQRQVAKGNVPLPSLPPPCGKAPAASCLNVNRSW